MPFPLTGPFQVGRPQAQLPFKLMPEYELQVSDIAPALCYALENSLKSEHVAEFSNPEAYLTHHLS